MKYKRDYNVSGVSRLKFNVANACQDILTKGDRANIGPLYKAMCMTGSRRSLYFSPVYNGSAKMPWLRGEDLPSDVFSVFCSVLNDLRRARNERRENDYKSMTERYLAGERVQFTPQHAPHSTVTFLGNFNFMRNRLREWKPGTMGDCRSKIVTHTSQHGYSNDLLSYTPHMNKLRHDGFKATGDAHIPVIATDRFILDYMMYGKPYVPSFIGDGDVISVKYITAKPVEVRDGYLAKVGTEFGCSHAPHEAIKAAKMRAVRKTKKALGIL